MQIKHNNLLMTEGWINGCAIQTDEQFPVLNPATGQIVASVADLDASHCADAIANAAAAFQDWKAVPPQDRAASVSRWADLIEENADDLGTILCAENGKPLGEAKGEALQCAALLRWFAQESMRLHGATLPSHSSEQRNYTIKQPMGVVACITPWNFPAAAVIVKAGAAISAGCTAIVKPSDETPLIALALAHLSDEADLPAGVFNVLPCKDPQAIGDEICQSTDVQMLTFTGSTRVGKHLYAACGASMKRVAMELGGNAPYIVFEDADLDKAIDNAVGARFYNSGQICVGANRFLIQKNIYDEFSRKLTDKVAKLTVGAGCEPSTNTGPMINHAAIDRLTGLIEDARSKGAQVQTGGDVDSLFFSPAVLTNMRTDMAAFRTEIFGPMACLYEFENDDEALTKANDTKAGLSAYVYSRDLKRLTRFTESLEAGVVGANSSNIFSNDLPFGGIKDSGVGKEHGIGCLDEFVETKSVCMGL